MLNQWINGSDCCQNGEAKKHAHNMKWFLQLKVSMLTLGFAYVCM